jgi:hypothetical protein
MGATQSTVVTPCINCKEPSQLKVSQDIFSRVDSIVPAYCTLECQELCMKAHWQLLMKVTDRALFNKLLSHLAGIVMRHKTAVRRRTHLCVVESGQCQLCIEVVKWFRLHANQGFKEHQANLGYCYEIGAGVPQSDIEAATWYGRAAANGHTESLLQLEQLFNRLEEGFRTESSTEEDYSSLEDPS